MEVDIRKYGNRQKIIPKQSFTLPTIFQKFGDPGEEGIIRVVSTKESCLYTLL